MSLNWMNYFLEDQDDNELFFHRFAISEHPDECPICHYSIQPKLIMGTGHQNISGKISITYGCPRLACGDLFIAIFESVSSSLGLLSYKLKKIYPVQPQDKTFDEDIQKLSPNFVTIYNQALQAEQLGLDQICGVGYRKSLEYLVKDYLISLDKSEEAVIKEEQLGQCINKIKDERIKNMAKRATWLGNDETHYVRIWESKDLSDMKALIDITVHFIKYELLEKQYVTEMPQPRKK